MLLFLLSLFATAEEPVASITVTDSRYEEIYFDEPRVMCETPCSFDQDTSSIFVEANSKHRTWLKSGTVSAIYNSETVVFTYDDCDFKKNMFKCANENSLWVLKTTITQDSERSSINFMLFDEQAVMIGQSTFTRFKKTRVIQRQKVTQQQAPGQAMSVSNCNQKSGNCATIPVQTNGQVARQTEDLEPTVIEVPPTITARDIGQAMIMLYDSVR